MTSPPASYPLSEIASFGSGATPSRSRLAEYFEAGTIPWVKTLDLNNGRIVRTDERITLRAIADTGLKIHPAGSVMVAMYGGFQQIGRTGILTFPAATNQALTTIIPDPKRLDGAYLLHVLNLRRSEWRHVAISSRKDANITKADVRGFSVLAPSLSEQRAMAEALDDVDRLLVGLGRARLKKQAIKQGIIQQLLTGRRQLPGFSAPWVERRVAHIAAITKGVQLSRKSMEPSRSVPVWNGGIEPSGHTSEPNVTRAVVTVSEGGNSCGWVGCPDGPFWLGGHCYALDPRGEGHSVPFLYHRLKCAEQEIMALRVGSGLPNIQKQRLGDLILAVPTDPREASAIADVLDDADRELRLFDARQAKARNIKLGIMQALLSGRIRLPAREGAA